MIATFKSYLFWILLFVMSATYLFPIDALFISLLAVLLFEMLIKGGRINLGGFPGAGIVFSLYAIGLMIGSVQMLMGEHTFRQLYKDVAYILLPILYWLVACNLPLSNTNKGRQSFTAIFSAGVIVSLYDLIMVVYKILTNGVLGLTLYEFRSLVGTSCVFALFSLLVGLHFWDTIKVPPVQKRLAILILAVDVLVHFSRMNLLIFAVFVVFSGVIKNPKALIKYAVAAGIAIALMAVVFPSMFQNYLNKLFTSSSELSFRDATWTHSTIVNNWRGYEVYCAIDKFTQASFLEKLFGGGLGTQLDLKGYAYLVTTEETIPFLHNGFFTALMIWGLVGIALLVIFFILLYTKSRLLPHCEARFWKVLVAVIAVETALTNGLFFSGGVACIMLYLGLLWQMKARATADTLQPVLV